MTKKTPADWPECSEKSGGSPGYLLRRILSAKYATAECPQSASPTNHKLYLIDLKKDKLKKAKERNPSKTESSDPVCKATREGNV